MKKDTSGPAFPATEKDHGLNFGDYGMTLRDYFAAKAIQGLLAHPECGEVGPGYEQRTKCIASEAYAVADAMLAERAK